MLLCECTSHSMLETFCQEKHRKWHVRRYAIWMGGLRLNFLRTEMLLTPLLTSNSIPFKVSSLPNQWWQQTCHSQRREWQERALFHESQPHGEEICKVGSEISVSLDGRLDFTWSAITFSFVNLCCWLFSLAQSRSGPVLFNLSN